MAHNRNRQKKSQFRVYVCMSKYYTYDAEDVHTNMISSVMWSSTIGMDTGSTVVRGVFESLSNRVVRLQVVTCLQ